MMHHEKINTAAEYTVAMSSLTKRRQWHKAVQLLRNMQCSSATVQANVISFNSAMGTWPNALTLFVEMVALHFQPTSISYNTLLSRSTSWPLAQHGFERMRQHNTSWDMFSFSAAIAGRHWPHAWKLFATATATMKPNVVSWNATISACEKDKQWAEALWLFFMFTSSCPRTLDVVTVNATISSCEKGSQWGHALHIFHTVPKMAIEADIISFNSTISSCEKAAQWQHAVSLFDSRKKVSPDIISFNAMISAFEKDGEWQQALHFFQLISRSNLQPTVVSFNAIISAFEKGGQWQYALSLFAHFLETNVQPDVISFSAAISSCEKTGQWQQALMLFAAMPGWRVLPSVVTFNATISACEKFQDVKRKAKQAFGKKYLKLINAKNRVLDNLEQTIEEAEIEDGECLTALVLQPELAATDRAFALWCHGDNKVVTWGTADVGGDSSAVQDQLKDVQQIQATKTAFAAILEDGSVVTWGSAAYGGDSSAVQHQLRGVQQIQASAAAFAAILEDGSVATWGHAGCGGDSSRVRDQLQNVQQIQASGGAFAAILEDGSVATWGHAGCGGDSSRVRDQLQNVQQIQATEQAFAAILEDGSVVTWGREGFGSDSSAVQDQLRGVQQIQATSEAFAAILADGSVVTWGDADHGGDSSAVLDQLKGVQQIQATRRAFAAILEDGSVVTWGDADFGGDREWQRALSLFEVMNCTSLQLDVITCNAVISACEKGFCRKAALKVLEEMVQKQLQPNVISCCAAISACERSGHWRQAFLLLATATLSDAESEVIAFNAALSACERAVVLRRSCGDWQEAVTFLEMIERQGYQPTVVTFGAAITACEKAKKWQHALEFFEIMSHAKIQLNIITFAATISACEKGGKWQHSLSLFTTMQDLQIHPNTISFNAAISSCEKGGKLQQALSLFKDMSRVRVQPNVISFNASISACEKSADWQQALKFFDDFWSAKVGYTILDGRSLVQQQLRLEGLSEEGRQWAKNPELKPKPKPERGMAFAIAHLDELIQKSQKKEQAAEENVASAQVPAVSELEAQAEMQTEAVKVEVLQSGEDAKTIVDSYWHQYCQMKDAEDAKTMVESYWRDFCEMKKASTMSTNKPVQNHKVTGLDKCHGGENGVARQAKVLLAALAELEMLTTPGSASDEALPFSCETQSYLGCSNWPRPRYVTLPVMAETKGEALKEVPLSDSEEEKVVEDGYGVAKDEAEEGDKGEEEEELDKATEMAGIQKFKLCSERCSEERHTPSPPRRSPPSKLRSDRSPSRGKGKGKGRVWNRSRRRLDDHELRRLVRDCGEGHDEIDLSRNSITSEGVTQILDICKKSPDLKVLKLFNNQLGDDGANELGEIFKHCHAIEEVHLSHNLFSETGVEAMVKAANRELPRKAERPLWLRMEHNKLQDTEKFARDIERHYPAVCAREDRSKCTPRVCALGKRIHLPFLIEMPKGKGRGRPERRHDGGAINGKGQGRRRRRDSRPPRRRSRPRPRSRSRSRSRRASPSPRSCQSPPRLRSAPRKRRVSLSRKRRVSVANPRPKRRALRAPTPTPSPSEASEESAPEQAPPAEAEPSAAESESEYSEKVSPRELPAEITKLRPKARPRAQPKVRAVIPSLPRRAPVPKRALPRAERARAQPGGRSGERAVDVQLEGMKMRATAEREGVLQDGYPELCPIFVEKRCGCETGAA
eukprot:symbB.v1.2.011847.t1/scaffold801.1/size161289/3